MGGIYLRPKDCQLMSVYELQPDFFEMSMGEAEHFLLNKERLLEWLKQGAWEKIDEEAV